MFIKRKSIDTNSSDRVQRIGGLSLVELSIVLLVVSIAVASLLVFDEDVKDINTKDINHDKLDKIEKALASYLATNDYYPCPADPRLATTDANFGIGSGTNTGTCTAVPSSGIADEHGENATYVGAIPTKQLGLHPEDAFDAWNNRLVYAVSQSQTFLSDGCGGNSSIPGIVILNKYTPGTAATAQPDENIVETNAAYVLLSYGPDGIGAYPRDASNGPITARSLGDLYEDSAYQQLNHGFDSNYSQLAHDYVFFKKEGDLPTLSGQQARFDDILRYSTDVVTASSFLSQSFDIPSNRQPSNLAFIGIVGGIVKAIDVENGSEAWSVDMSSDYGGSACPYSLWATHDDYLYLIMGCNGDPHIVKLNANNGVRIWDKSFPADQHPVDGSTVLSTDYTGNVYVGTSVVTGSTNRLLKISSDGLTERYNVDAGWATVGDTDGDITALWMSKEGVLVLGARDGTVLRVNRHNGNVVWENTDMSGLPVAELNINWSGSVLVGYDETGVPLLNETEAVSLNIDDGSNNWAINIADTTPDGIITGVSSGTDFHSYNVDAEGGIYAHADGDGVADPFQKATYENFSDIVVDRWNNLLTVSSDGHMRRMDTAFNTLWHNILSGAPNITDITVPSDMLASYAYVLDYVAVASNNEFGIMLEGDGVKCRGNSHLPSISNRIYDVVADFDFNGYVIQPHSGLTKFDFNCNVETIPPVSPTTIFGPLTRMLDIAINRYTESIYVSDDRGRIRKLNLDGTVDGTFAFDNISGNSVLIAIDEINNRLYVASPSVYGGPRDELLRIEPDSGDQIGSITPVDLTTLGTEASAIGVGGDGSVYVYDDSEIRRFDSELIEDRTNWPLAVGGTNILDNISPGNSGSVLIPFDGFAAGDGRTVWAMAPDGSYRSQNINYADIADVAEGASNIYVMTEDGNFAVSSGDSSSLVGVTVFDNDVGDYGAGIFPMTARITNPGGLAKTVGWYDASDPCTLRAVSASAPHDCTGNMLNHSTPNQEVGCWEDKSGQGNHAVINSSPVSVGPLAYSRTKNSQNVLEFSNFTDVSGTFQRQLKIDYSTAIGTNGKTIYAVFKRDSIPSASGDSDDSYLLGGRDTLNLGEGLAIRMNNDGSSPLSNQLFRGTNAPGLYWGTLIQDVSGSPVEGLFDNVLEITTDGTYARVNHNTLCHDPYTDSALSTSGANPGSNAISGFTIGGRHNTISGATDSSLDGYIAELIIIDYVLGPEEQGLITDYLMKKWDIESLNYHNCTVDGQSAGGGSDLSALGVTPAAVTCPLVATDGVCGLCVPDMSDPYNCTNCPDPDCGAGSGSDVGCGYCPDGANGLCCVANPPLGEYCLDYVDPDCLVGPDS